MIRRLALALTLLASSPAFADTAAVERTFLERAAISAADERCSLFSPGERLALRSGLYQSQNELLRAGYTIWKIRQTGDEARAHARGLGCDHPAVRSVSAAVRDSYRMFIRTNFLEFPSTNGKWAVSRVVHDQWAMKEVDAASGVQFGLRRGGLPQFQRFMMPPEPGAEAGIDLRLAVALPAAAWEMQPASVQLRMRDPDKLGEPWLGALSGSSGRLGAPPRSVSRSEWAGGWERSDDITRVTFIVYYFPASVAARIEALDPRETIVIEVTPSPRAADTAVKAYLFEVGDFRAGRAFALIPQPSASSAPPAEQPAAGAHH
jgi:hypothetical protein